MAVGLAAVLVNRSSGPSTGPVSGGGGYANGQAIDVGVPYSFGYLLTTAGKQPATLERVRVLGVTGPIEVLGVMARPHPSGPKPGLFMLAFGFPPADYPAKSLAEEHVIPVPKTFSENGSPVEGLQIVVGVKSTGLGVGRIRGIEFTYRVGKHRYRNSSDGEGYLCAPASDYLQGGSKVQQCLDPPVPYTFARKSVDFQVPSASNS